MSDMTLSEELQWRGFINQSTFDDLTQLDKQQWTFYHGFDASADSQTVGNLAAMMFDKVFMRHGHKAIILAGGATSLIGDPGGKDSERTLQSEETVAHNVECAKQQLSKVLYGHEFTLVNNLDWTKNMSVIEFLRDIGKHFSMTPLVQRDYIAKRIGEGGAGISFTEFSYTILQGMDFLHLFDTYGATLQLGGADQWGNCLSGVDLLRRARGQEAHVITLPLVINKATGKKFGKSEEGAVWLDPAKTSPFKFYQFWLNVDDEGVEGYLKIFTELSKSEIDAVMAEFAESKAGRAAQKKLAQEVTKIVHGVEAAAAAQKATESLFDRLGQHTLDQNELAALKGDLPVVQTQSGDTILEIVVRSGFASSKSEAMRLLQGGAISVNWQKGVAATDEDLALLMPHQGLNLIKVGKNNFAIVEVA